MSITEMWNHLHHRTVELFWDRPGRIQRTFYLLSCAYNHFTIVICILQKRSCLFCFCSLYYNYNLLSYHLPTLLVKITKKYFLEEKLKRMHVFKAHNHIIIILCKIYDWVRNFISIGWKIKTLWPKRYSARPKVLILYLLCKRWVWALY